MKPFSPSCERNREPIFEELASLIKSPAIVLELGSGTGQHAIHMGSHLPGVTWLTSDLPENHPGIELWLQEYGLNNVRSPIDLDVTGETWAVPEPVDFVFSANMVHIMPWENAACLFRGAARVLKEGGKLCLYGPFNYNGNFTSPSNASFNQWLLDRNTAFGIRNFEDMLALGETSGLTFMADKPMPANNRFLVWQLNR